MCCGGAWRALSVFPRMHASFRFLRYRVIIIIYCSNVFIRHIQLGCISFIGRRLVRAGFSRIAMQRDATRQKCSAKSNEAAGER